MNYIVTKGDLEITKNVLSVMAQKLGNNLTKELGHFKNQIDCPCYIAYNNVIDTLVYLDSHYEDLIT